VQAGTDLEGRNSTFVLHEHELVQFDRDEPDSDNPLNFFLFFTLCIAH
jgi:hypothetical protein